VKSVLCLSGLDVAWHDARVPVSAIDLRPLLGVVVNISSRSCCMKFFHWYTIRAVRGPLLPFARVPLVDGDSQVQGTFFNFDSKLKAPEAFGTVDAMLTHLQTQVDAGNHVLLVARKPTTAMNTR
jgi:hypothetical protein